MTTRVCVGMLLWLGLPMFGASEVAAPAQAVSALPAGYREALQQLDADSLSAADIGDKLTALSALQTPTCRDTLHRQIAEARHPSRFLPLLKAFPGATSFRIACRSGMPLQNDFVVGLITPDCAEALIDDDQVQQLWREDHKLSKAAAAAILYHQCREFPDPGPEWQLPALRKIYADAAKTDDLAPLFLPEFPPELHRRLRREISFAAGSELDLASFARGEGANWVTYLESKPLWSALLGNHEEITRQLKRALDLGLDLPLNKICQRALQQATPKQRLAWMKCCPEIMSFMTDSSWICLMEEPAPGLWEFMGAEKKYYLDSDWRRSIIDSHQQQVTCDEVSDPPELATAPLPEDLDTQKFEEECAAITAAEMMTRLRHQFTQAQIRTLFQSFHCPQLKVRHLTELLGEKYFFTSMLSDHLPPLDLVDLQAMLASPERVRLLFNRISNCSLSNFLPAAPLELRSQMEDWLWSQPLELPQMQELISWLDGDQVISLPRLYRRCAASLTVYFDDTPDPAVYRYLNPETISPASVKWAFALSRYEKHPLQEVPLHPELLRFLDRLEADAQALPIDSLPIALELLHRCRPDSPGRAKLLRRLLRAHHPVILSRSDYAGDHLDPAHWLPPDFRPKAQDLVDLALLNKLCPDTLSDAYRRLIPAAAAKDLADEDPAFDQARRQGDSPLLEQCFQPPAHEAFRDTDSPHSLHYAVGLLHRGYPLPPEAFAKLLVTEHGTGAQLTLLHAACTYPPLAPAVRQHLLDWLASPSFREVLFLDEGRSCLTERDFYFDAQGILAGPESLMNEVYIASPRNRLMLETPELETSRVQIWRARCKAAKRLSPQEKEAPIYRELLPLPPLPSLEKWEEEKKVYFQRRDSAITAKLARLPMSLLEDFACEAQAQVPKATWCRLVLEALDQGPFEERQVKLLRILPSELKSTLKLPLIPHLRLSCFLGLEPKNAVPNWLQDRLSLSPQDFRLVTECSAADSQYHWEYKYQPTWHHGTEFVPMNSPSLIFRESRAYAIFADGRRIELEVPIDSLRRFSDDDLIAIDPSPSQLRLHQLRNFRGDEAEDYPAVLAALRHPDAGLAELQKAIAYLPDDEACWPLYRDYRKAKLALYQRLGEPALALPALLDLPDAQLLPLIRRQLASLGQEARAKAEEILAKPRPDTAALVDLFRPAAAPTQEPKPPAPEVLDPDECREPEAASPEAPEVPEVPEVLEDDSPRL